MTGAIDRPVFVLCCAWRCGSTLIQRVLSSGPELFIWGENVGMSALLHTIERRLATYEGRSAREWQDFRERGAAAWIACLNPPFPDGVREAARAFYRGYFEARTAALGRTRWGFKEVRHGAETAAYLGDLFPDARFVFVLRNPTDVVASMATRSWYDAEGGAEGVLRTWRENTSSLLGWGDPRLVTVRYETLIADPAAETARLARHLDLDLSRLDLTLFARPERGFPAAPALGIEERRALANPELLTIAARAEYEVADDPRFRFTASATTSAYLYARRVYLRIRDALRPTETRQIR